MSPLIHDAPTGVGVGSPPTHTLPDHLLPATREPLLYRDLEAAALLGVSRANLWKLIKAGKIQSVKIGALRRIPRAALVEYVDSLRQPPAA